MNVRTRSPGTTSSPVPGHSARRLFKNVAEALASRLPRRTTATGSLVLAYHNVVPTEDAGRGDVSLHLPLDVFTGQLDVARSEADVVDLPTLVRDLGRPGRRIAVTFDDAYLGCVTHALPACAARGVVPTVFVAPGLYGTIPPWDRAADDGAWSDTDRDRFLGQQYGRAAESVPATPSTLPESYRVATLDVLQRTASTVPFHVGNHSVGHANLAALAEHDLQQEVREGAAHVANFGGCGVPFLAYPYGLAPASERRPALEAWCEAAFLVDGGWCAPGGGRDRMSLPRLNVPAGLSVAGFRARVRGWL